MEMHSRTFSDRNNRKQSVKSKKNIEKQRAKRTLSHSCCQYHYDINNTVQISMSKTSKFQKIKIQKCFALDPLGSSKCPQTSVFVHESKVLLRRSRI